MAILAETGWTGAVSLPRALLAPSGPLVNPVPWVATGQGLPVAPGAVSEEVVTAIAVAADGELDVGRASRRNAAPWKVRVARNGPVAAHLEKWPADGRKRRRLVP